MQISIYGLWRDSEKYIQRSLNCIEQLLQISDISFSFYFYENDSVDNTKNILSNWCNQSDNRLLITENLGLPKFGSVPDIQRLVFLSHYRNKFCSFFQEDNADYSLLLDTDIVFTQNDFLNLLEHIQSLDAAAVVANTRQKDIPDLMFNKTNDSFYDVFCLRDRFFNGGLYFTDCPLLLEDDRSAWNKNLPVEISSGFGGFCLAKTKNLRYCKWSTCSQSEHVNFFSMLKQYGKIFMIPSCKPYTDIDISKISIDNCKKIAEQQVMAMDQINKIYNASLQNKI